MKTKTIDKLIELSTTGGDAIQKIREIAHIVTQEKKRKEQKQNKTTIYHHQLTIDISEIEVKIKESFDFGLKEGLKLGRWPFGISQQGLYGFHITPTGNIIVDDKEAFKKLVDKINKIFTEQCL